MGDKWPYSCCFVSCCFRDLFHIAHSILVQFPSSFFSLHFVGVRVVHLYTSIDTTATWKKSCFISSDRSDFYMIDNLSIVVNAFAWHVLTLLSVDETLLLRKLVNWFQKSAILSGDDSSFKTYILRFVCVPVKVNASCYLLQAILQGFSLGRCIYKKGYIIYIVCVCNSFCWV